MRGIPGDRNRAVLLALIATFIALVIGKILFGFFWVVALAAAVVVFTVMFGFFLRVQRNRR
jgi:ABC-type multidrug transport system permease subunit